jgi:hypothetical protein
MTAQKTKSKNSLNSLKKKMKIPKKLLKSKKFFVLFVKKKVKKNLLKKVKMKKK